MSRLTICVVLVLSLGPHLRTDLVDLISRALPVAG